MQRPEFKRSGGCFNALFWPRKMVSALSRFSGVNAPFEAVHSNFFAQTEPSWRPLLQRPKRRKQNCESWTEKKSGKFKDFEESHLDLVKQCKHLLLGGDSICPTGLFALSKLFSILFVQFQCFLLLFAQAFLHMGTSALSSGLADFLTKLGWTLRFPIVDSFFCSIFARLTLLYLNVLCILLRLVWYLCGTNQTTARQWGLNFFLIHFKVEAEFPRSPLLAFGNHSTNSKHTTKFARRQQPLNIPFSVLHRNEFDIPRPQISYLQRDLVQKCLFEGYATSLQNYVNMLAWWDEITKLDVWSTSWDSDVRSSWIGRGDKCFECWKVRLVLSVSCPETIEIWTYLNMYIHIYIYITTL